MKRDSKTAKVIRVIQAREDAQLRRRKERLMRALRKHIPALLDFEVRQLEGALAPALGRIVLE